MRAVNVVCPSIISVSLELLAKISTAGTRGRGGTGPPRPEI